MEEREAKKEREREKERDRRGADFHKRMQMREKKIQDRENNK